MAWVIRIYGQDGLARYWSGKRWGLLWWAEHYSGPEVAPQYLNCVRRLSLGEDYWYRNDRGEQVAELMPLDGYPEEEVGNGDED